MNQLEQINKGMFDLWRGENWYEYTHFLSRKKIKFFLMNPSGVFRVQLKDQVVYEGKDLNQAIKIYNQL